MRRQGAARPTETKSVLLLFFRKEDLPFFFCLDRTGAHQASHLPQRSPRSFLYQTYQLQSCQAAEDIVLMYSW
jgi:hypothetical protein